MLKTKDNSIRAPLSQIQVIGNALENKDQELVVFVGGFVTDITRDIYTQFGEAFVSDGSSNILVRILSMNNPWKAFFLYTQMR